MSGVKKSFGKSARCLLAILVGWHAPLVFAHTDFRDLMSEGSAAFNALVIEHGCENPVTGKSRPVIAQSVVFPTDHPLVTRSDGTSSPGLDAEITNPAGLAGLVGPIQSKDLFRKQSVLTDANGNAIGFNGTRGVLKQGLLGVVPFNFAPVSFLPSSCAKSLAVRVAVADICSRKFPPKPGTANLWIPATTSKFGNGAVEGIGDAPVLTIKRDLTANPLPVPCGDGYEVTVTPSNDDVDAHLPIKGYWTRR